MDHAYGIQFHIEIKDNTVSQCIVYQNMKKLWKIASKDALKLFDLNAKLNMKSINSSAEIYTKILKNYLILVTPILNHV